MLKHAGGATPDVTKWKGVKHDLKKKKIVP